MHNSVHVKDEPLRSSFVLLVTRRWLFYLKKNLCVLNVQLLTYL